MKVSILARLLSSASAALHGWLPAQVVLRLVAAAGLGFPAARRHLRHYLAGQGADLRIPLRQLVAQDRGLRTRLNAELLPALAHGIDAGEVRVAQWQLSSWNWRLALGSFRVRWERSGEQVILSVRKHYRWHPDEPRPTQGLHRMACAAAGAQPYSMVGDALAVPAAALRVPGRFAPRDRVYL